MLKLDFTLETAAERTEFVNKYLDPYGTHYTQKELETIANYILFGKDEDGTSAVDRKEIQIQTKHNTYKRREPESLEALLESPTFDERAFSHNELKYKHPKPTIDREKDADVPGMKELWEQIDKVAYLIDVNKGKIKDDSVRKLTDRELYEYSHLLVELRRQQFTLKDSVKPVICRTKTNVTQSFYEVGEEVPWEEVGSDFDIRPMGTYPSNKMRFEDPRNLIEIDYQPNAAATTILNFCDPLHIYALYENYMDLEEEADKNPESVLGNILETLKWYEENCGLTEVQKEILKLKIEKKSNEYIADYLHKNFNTTHSPNYISTIYKQHICKEIADFAQLRFDYYMNREILNKWKKCGKCGKWKLVDERDFSKRSRNADGYASICKNCERLKRIEKKKE